MATTTTNLGLIEPAGQDRALVANINTNSEKIDAEAGKARANFALVQNGDTATQAISQGQLVVWKGALKKATANIANGATLSSSNLTDDSIATEIASLNDNITTIDGKIGVVPSGKTVQGQLTLLNSIVQNFTVTTDGVNDVPISTGGGTYIILLKHERNDGASSIYAMTKPSNWVAGNIIEIAKSPYYNSSDYLELIGAVDNKTLIRYPREATINILLIKIASY